MSIIPFKAETRKPRRQQLRIAVAIDDAGNWIARGGSELADSTLSELLDHEYVEFEGDGRQQYWLLVEVPLPPTEVLATDTDDDGSPEAS
jgi:hypothetical protein